MLITGFVKYIPLSGGFWGIVDLQGKQWFPVNMPETLKKEGLSVSINAQKAENFFSIYMWGTPIQIHGFAIISN